MTGFSRIDTSTFARWWWTVDRWTFVAVALLIVAGALLTLAASPPAAKRIGLDSFHFVYRQAAYLLVATSVLISVSLLTPSGVRRLGLILFGGGLALLAATPFIGVEIKGARRWIALWGISLQPIEIVRPAFAVVAAWLFAAAHSHERFPGRTIATLLYLAVVALLLMQPDFGMAVVVSLVWFLQFFLAGLPLPWVGVLVSLGLTGLAAGYLSLPHVANRVDRFLDPASGDTYQVSTGLEAFMNGGLFGRGPGEGRVKEALPDAHADFVFAVAGEEFGLIACLAIVALFAFVVLRGFARAISEGNLFVMLASAGLLAHFGLQALVNMASTLSLAPTKGLTLPFISYGGSSLIGAGVAMGMVLALTRRHAGVAR